MLASLPFLTLRSTSWLQNRATTSPVLAEPCFPTPPALRRLNAFCRTPSPPQMNFPVSFSPERGVAGRWRCVLTAAPRGAGAHVGYDDTRLSPPPAPGLGGSTSQAVVGSTQTPLSPPCQGTTAAEAPGNLQTLALKKSRDGGRWGAARCDLSPGAVMDARRVAPQWGHTAGPTGEGPHSAGAEGRGSRAARWDPREQRRGERAGAGAGAAAGGRATAAAAAFLFFPFFFFVFLQPYMQTVTSG